MASDRCNCYFTFWVILSPFTSVTVPKKRISKKLQNAWRHHDFIYVYQKSWSYAILFLRYGA